MKLRTKIRNHERGLVFHEKEFVRVIGPGTYWDMPAFSKQSIEIVSQRNPWIQHAELDLIVKSGALDAEAEVIDLKDGQYGLVWIDGRFDGFLSPGLHVHWKGFRQVRVDITSTQNPLFEHPELATILAHPSASGLLSTLTVTQGFVGLCYHNGVLHKSLSPGRYAAWRQGSGVTVKQEDLRERVVEVGGQEIMTADKVSLRLNSAVTFRVTDPAKTIQKVSEVSQAIYRDAQLGLRETVGTRNLDALLADKTTVAEELEAGMRQRAQDYGVEVLAVGIKDIILPGDMKVLLNKVIEAQKASEANVIARREETAAMRSQLNTARLMEENPALMRLRELEVLERVAQHSKLNVVLGERGLMEQVTHLV